jgi:hypothetical protein
LKSVVGALWEANDAVAKPNVEAFYHPMEESVMACTKAAWALNCAAQLSTQALKTPLEQRAVFVHIGV